MTSTVFNHSNYQPHVTFTLTRDYRGYVTKWYYAHDRQLKSSKQEALIRESNTDIDGVLCGLSRYNSRGTVIIPCGYVCVLVVLRTATGSTWPVCRHLADCYA